jgi:hypothetical protein
MLKSLLVLTETFPIPSRKEFDTGKVSFEFNQFVNLLRSFFLTSNSIRKGRTIYLLIFKQNIQITIAGEHLKYLAADFRTAGAIIMNFLQIIYPASNKKILIKKREILERKGSVLASPGIIIEKKQEFNIDSIIAPYILNAYCLSFPNEKQTQEKSIDIDELPLQTPKNLIVNFSSAWKPQPTIPNMIFAKKLGETPLDISEQILWLNFLEDNIK